ncbi:DUF1549 domain-containing protein [Aurantibacter crassamenti]|uniref:DUF1553 domain-containing protein n=1 Tax=Aurantibacter crassamenti TaxID=1837375 RepID=UPI0019393FF1|nr:DUF1553 domain-containing protein [Aurantibacter crassamenti]MBM1106828.1 DUF1549 domain-containing protein [Aurantibacter crassamenti]
MTKYLYLLLIPLLWSCQDSKNNQISFNRDVRPILNDKCLRCHGGVKASGQFSLLFEEDAFNETQSGAPAIVRGNHSKSQLYKRIVHDDPELRMPVDAPPLSEKEVEILVQWIDQGAKWEKHWAYIPPKTDIEPPEIDSLSWANNKIDQFVYAKMQEKELSPSPEADKATLLRRLYLDLIGIPPTIKEVEAFMANNSADAYEKEVDKIMASPHFGERWAAMWMDMARYADSKGYEKDSNREIWKFRDYVINAFNEDKPFDQFSIEQLAGDLLPNPSEEQLIATAFHRNTLANDEGGTDNEEFRIAAVVERVATTYEVWQGTTMSCVQCHSHPYDPFRHEEFYESMAFFNNARDNDSYFEEPKLFTYSEENKKEVASLLNFIDTELLPEDAAPKLPYLHSEKEAVLTRLGHRMREAESFYESSPFIELDESLNLLWQIQDSSWVKYDKIDLKNINEIGFFASATIGYAGDISIHLDSLNGKKIGGVKITRTGATKKGYENRNNTREFKASIDAVEGKRDVYLRFFKGERFDGHLFFLDKMRFYEREPRMQLYSADFQKKLEKLAEMPTTSTPIIEELPQAESRKTHLFERGSWLSLGNEVERGIPNIYGQEEAKEPKDRLAFAQWMMSTENPLAARVAVNRFWEQLFGFGLVESMEEFGTQGEKPTHPELLDWMAVRFETKHEWQVKPFLRELVLSATYRQSSDADVDKIEKDARNQWLSRGFRTRLSAEQIRDQVLTVSDLLNPVVGGPSVVNSSVDGGWTGVPDWAIKGDSAEYRRSLYTLWKRVTPPNEMLTFDSPDRSVCASRRIRTNTPLQALNLLNDETFFEASNALATQMYESDDDIEKQLTFGYSKVMGRSISDKKLKLLKELYLDAQLHFKDETKSVKLPEAAEGKFGNEKNNLAALAIVANAMLNLDEFIVKG